MLDLVARWVQIGVQTGRGRILTKSWLDYTEGTPERSLPGLTLAGVLILTLVVIWLFIIRQRQRRQPFLLFYELSQAHGINSRWEHRLVHLARIHRIKDPSLLFVCPDLVKRVRSLEMSETRSEKQRQRLEAFFSDFEAKIFG